MTRPRATDGELLGRDFITSIVVFHDLVGQLLGVSAVERKCLDLVSRGPVTAGAIAEHTGLTTGAVTSLVDRLVKAGYVQRTADAEDRRRVLVVLREGTLLDVVIPEVFGPLGEEISTFAARYDSKEIEAIADFMKRTTDVLRHHTRRLSENPPRR